MSAGFNYGHKLKEGDAQSLVVFINRAYDTQVLNNMNCGMHLKNGGRTQGHGLFFVWFRKAHSFFKNMDIILAFINHFLSARVNIFFHDFSLLRS